MRLPKEPFTLDFWKDGDDWVVALVHDVVGVHTFAETPAAAAASFFEVLEEYYDVLVGYGDNVSPLVREEREHIARLYGFPSAEDRARLDKLVAIDPALPPTAAWAKRPIPEKFKAGMRRLPRPFPEDPGE